MLSTQTPPEWRAWNEANARAAATYHDQPTAACRYDDCPHMAAADSDACRNHLRALAEDRERQREARRKNAR